MLHVRDTSPAAPFDGLTVGLVNNMPDGALLATEQQFTAFLAKAAGANPLRLRLYSLPGLERGPEGAAAIAARYRSTATLPLDPPDALIVTGSEPRAPTLPAEAYWADLAALVDWAATNTAAALWSCLAAHAAVLHRDGVERRRMPAKRAGLFGFTQASPHPLLAGVPPVIRVPHSRWNDLDAGELAAAGYQVLTQTAEAGVDLFAKDVGTSLFTLFQGHPEYDPDTLSREYRRDVSRFLRGEQASYPGLPRHYFAPDTEQAFGQFQVRAEAARQSVSLRDLPRQPAFRAGLVDGWQATSVPVLRNWLALAAGRAGRRWSDPDRTAGAAPVASAA